MTHQVITDVIVKLNGEVECNVSCASTRVIDEVGFDVVLMNTKCNQLTDCDATKGMDFWKSSRKIFAMHSEMYERVCGKERSYNAAIDLTQTSDSIDDTSSENGPPAKKGKTMSREMSKLNEIHSVLCKFETTSRKIPEMVASSLECIVCKGVIEKPMFSSCCDRILGCQTCISNWLSNSSTCPEHDN